MKPRTIHVWSALLTWLYLINLSAGLLAGLRQWRPTETPTVEVQTTTPPNVPMLTSNPVATTTPPNVPMLTSNPVATTTPPKVPTLTSNPVATPTNDPTHTSVTPVSTTNPPVETSSHEPEPEPKLSGGVVVILMKSEAASALRPSFDKELAKFVKKVGPGKLVGGSAWVLGPNSDPARWPEPESSKVGEFRAEEAGAAFDAAAKGVAWIDARAESPGMPVILIWPSEQRPEDGNVAASPKKSGTRSENVVWVGGARTIESQWLADRFGPFCVTHIDGSPVERLAGSLEFIFSNIDAPNARRNP